MFEFLMKSENRYLIPLVISDLPMEDQIKLIEFNPANFEFIKKPSDTLIAAIIPRSPWAIEMLNVYDESIVRLALHADPHQVFKVYYKFKKVPADMLDYILQASPTFIKYIENPTDDQINIAFSRNPAIIAYIKNQTEEQQLSVIASDVRNAVNILINPTLKVKKALLVRDPYQLYHFENDPDIAELVKAMLVHITTMRQSYYMNTDKIIKIAKTKCPHVLTREFRIMLGTKFPMCINSVIDTLDENDLIEIIIKSNISSALHHLDKKTYLTPKVIDGVLKAEPNSASSFSRKWMTNDIKEYIIINAPTRMNNIGYFPQKRALTILDRAPWAVVFVKNAKHKASLFHIAESNEFVARYCYDSFNQKEKLFLKMKFSI